MLHGAAELNVSNSISSSTSVSWLRQTFASVSLVLLAKLCGCELHALMRRVYLQSEFQSSFLI